jgi:hypothetical protein
LLHAQCLKSHLVITDRCTVCPLLPCAAAPFEPQAAGGQYSYQPLTTFANNVGQLVAVRCVGSKQPGSLCAYNGYDAAMPTSAARPRLRLGGGTHAALLAVLLGAASCLALL